MDATFDGPPASIVQDMKTNKLIMLLVLACTLAYLCEVECRMKHFIASYEWHILDTPNDSSSQHRTIPRLFASN